jgi:N-acetylneuraminate synthase
VSIYVICEIGINHNGSLETAKRLIDAAKDAGADSVKFQARTIELVYLPEELARPRESPFGHTNGDLKRGLEFSVDQYAVLDRYCADVGIAWSASCWDVQSVARIAAFRPPWLKIPSALITDTELLIAYRETKIPILMSTGMSTWKEIDAAVAVFGGIPSQVGQARDFGGRVLFHRVTGYDLTLLHAHSSYPSPLDELNLACIQRLKGRYGLPVGYSSHSVSPWPCLMAAVCGAEVIEFHLTLDRSLWGSDQAASLEPHAAKKLVEEIRTWEICKGDGEKRVWPSELPAKEKLRRVHE